MNERGAIDAIVNEWLSALSALSRVAVKMN